MSITTKAVSYSGTALYPTTISVSEEVIEDSERMADASLRVWQRGTKSKWSLHWSGLAEGSVGAIRTLFRAGGFHNYVDEFGGTYSARPKSFRASLSADFIGIASAVIHYDVDLELEEA